MGTKTMTSEKTETGGSNDSPTMLQQRGVQRRMRCSGSMANGIQGTFVTVEQLVDAIESDDDLTDYDNIGPKTAETIREWWENRFEREEKMDSATVERTGRKTASVYFHKSWGEALGGDPTNKEDYED